MKSLIAMNLYGSKIRQKQFQHITKKVSESLELSFKLATLKVLKLEDVEGTT